MTAEQEFEERVMKEFDQKLANNEFDINHYDAKVKSFILSKIKESRKEAVKSFLNKQLHIGPDIINPDKHKTNGITSERLIKAYYKKYDPGSIPTAEALKSLEVPND